MALQYPAAPGRKQQIAVLGTVALVDQHSAMLDVAGAHPAGGYLANAHGGVREQLQHDLMADVTTVLVDMDGLLQVDRTAQLLQPVLPPSVAGTKLQSIKITLCYHVE